jgi:hypothetical protein
MGRKSTIDPNATHVYDRGNSPNDIALDGNCRVIRKNPHAIAVDSGLDTVTNCWFTMSMVISMIVNYAILKLFV